MDYAELFNDNNSCNTEGVKEIILLEGKFMKRRIFSTIIAMGMMIGLFLCSNSTIFPATVAYAENNASGIIINGEYTVPDSMGWCTYYVVVATNNTGSDISINADFFAKDASGNVIRKVNDYAEAVKQGQQFILYGQFVNDKVRGASNYEYKYTVSNTDKCAYNLVAVDTEKIDNEVKVSATNNSNSDVQSVGVRTLFMNGGRAVAFDTVNIADSGINFKGGSTNSQMIGAHGGNYDAMVMTYTTVAYSAQPEDL